MADRDNAKLSTPAYSGNAISSPIQSTFSELSHRRKVSADIEGRASTKDGSWQAESTSDSKDKSRPQSARRSVSSSLVNAQSQTKNRRVFAYLSIALGCSLLLLLSILFFFPDVPATDKQTLVGALKRYSPKAGKPNIFVRDINVRPPTRKGFQSASSLNDQTRYLAYFTHSGYHNQRIALENALTLAKLLNRTLLIPPVRFGNAIPYISFDKLHLRLNQATKDGLLHCRDYDEYGILPRECIDFFDWTLVSWDFLVNMTQVEETLQQPIIDRWNGTLEWLEDTLGIREDEDIYAFKDDNMYQFRYYDSKDDTEALEKFEKRIDLSDLKLLDEYRLVHVGSLFGTSRMRTIEEENWEVRSAFRQAMVFSNPAMDGITNKMCAMLGGEAGYYSVHFRVGDGIFLKEAQKNALSIFRQLLNGKMKLSNDFINNLIRQSAPELLPSSSLDVHEEGDGDLEGTLLDRRSYDAEESHLRKRASNSRPQRPGAYKHPWPKPIKPIKQRSDSPLHAALSCRGPLYTDPSSPLLALNAPLFLATDSRIPESDPHLAIFFKTFPCTFVLADFGPSSKYNSQPIEALHHLDAWRNSDDHVPLAPFLYPVVDMMVAAKGRAIVGTPKSTFSRFAIDVLHQSYHGRPSLSCYTYLADETSSRLAHC